MSLQVGDYSQKMLKCFLHIQISLTTTLIFNVALKTRFHHEHHHEHHRHHHDHDGTCETCALACWPADAAQVLNWTSVWLSPDTCVVCSNNIIVLDLHCIILWRSTSEVIFWPEVSAWWVMGWGRLLTPEHLQEPEQSSVQSISASSNIGKCGKYVPSGLKFVKKVSISCPNDVKSWRKWVNISS